MSQLPKGHPGVVGLLSLEQPSAQSHVVPCGSTPPLGEEPGPLLQALLLAL